ncbi:5-(carboxyamino)imidazole ribonucleotide synthase [Candidatus Acetothermia bacterium]|jgi:5-(carboxyamino)imidazole ribonucleotide synthase|nr:5-(carboxyamino)imidazole ribonucleotide synthase [Candidatus Acetothermia bacterium]MCI2432545.1 5-(carboxyamino)imidazole ribonucleotide synthase [Candidatus Acetothermia bacterium]MCI2435878.1 5-(carboxyamino)imidazole ribonucleotide synthase [Candidatus Acetothermia bacterium]
MTIGILGGGQLGRMLALAGYPLGLRLRFLDPAAEAPVKDLSELNVAPYDDYEALRRFAQDCDLITYEFENVPAESARFLSSMRAIYPPPKALDASQDRFAEKNFFQSLSIPTPRFALVASAEDLKRAIQQIGLPAVLKTRRMGYDGKGQTIVREQSDLLQTWEALGRTSLILEEFIQFERELSMLAVRSRTGELAFYPLVENHHRDGILRLSLAPAPGVSAQLQALAESYARKILEALNYVGVLALELFDVGALCAVPLLANEMAPRVHNSGHWTIEGAVTSQFENHLRAILGWPLGSIEPRGYCAMLNLIGRVPNSETVLKIPGAHLHLYGKSPRPGRKLGHITLCETSEELLEAKLAQLQALL